MSADESGESPVIAARVETVRIRAALTFGIEGDLKFLSHHDEMRMLTRAMIRAAWPLAYSQGFNPQPRLTLPLPRAVGTASDAEMAIVDLTHAAEVAGLHESLARQMPTGAPLHAIVVPMSPGTPHPVAVEYAVELEASDAQQVGEKLTATLAAERLDLMRQYGSGKPPRRIDVRPLIERLSLEGLSLVMRLRFESQGTARPGEVLECLGVVAGEYEHRIRRRRVDWDKQIAGDAQSAATAERT
ncbi:MAG: TIGR03936 family radical SAM-associated protein [Phycisphaerae bacterium]